MNIEYDLVDPVELTQYARQYNLEILQNQFVLNRWLPETQNSELEWWIRRGQLVDVDVAEYRAFDTPAPMTGRQGITRIRGEIAPLARMIPMTEEEAIRWRSLDRQTDDPVINAVYDDVERMTRAVAARLELARGDALTDGIVTLNENGFNLTVDYGMPSQNKPVAAKAWTDPTALVIDDLLTWQTLLIDTFGITPEVILLSKQRINALLVNQQVLSYNAGLAGTPTRITLEDLQRSLALEGLPPIQRYDTKVRVNGVQTRCIPADHCIMLPPPGSLGETQFGVTAEATQLRARNLIAREEAPGIIAMVLQNEHPVQTFTLATAIALPMLGNPDYMISATV